MIQRICVIVPMLTSLECLSKDRGNDKDANNDDKNVLDDI